MERILRRRGAIRRVKNDDADADAYDKSDAYAAAYGGDEL